MTDKKLTAPGCTKLQVQAAQQDHPPVPRVCLVTGGTGFVGQRLVEMLVERGAERVVSFDVVPKPKQAWDHPAIEWVVGDVTDAEALVRACKGVDCVWHNAAAVGPFHPKQLYEQVNHQGTLNVINACRKQNVGKVIMSSSPSTRFTGSDVDGLSEDDLPKLPLPHYLQEYAASKARGELAMLAANSPTLQTIAIAPHQVYGPRDNLFLPNVLEAAGTGRLRIFGKGENRICFTHVDNYAHGLIVGERALTGDPDGPGGKFYIVTDGDTHPVSAGYGLFWRIIDQAVVAMGFTSLYAKFKLPKLLLMAVAWLCDCISSIAGITLKLSVFNVRMLTMHRWFETSNSERDLNYKPIIAFQEGWDDTIEWFKQSWLPGFQKKQNSGMGGIARGTQGKIDVQKASLLKQQDLNNNRLATGREKMA